MDDVKTPECASRAYDSSRRRARAALARRWVVDTAIGLFTAQGYAATSLQSIADQADVSVQTIYAAFGNKRAVLAEALDAAIAGDHLPQVVNAREWMQAVWDAPTAEARLGAYSKAVCRIMISAGDMFQVVDAAAAVDPALAELAAETEQRRRLGAEAVVRSIGEVGALRTGLTESAAIDVLWLLNSPQVFRQLVRRSGWSQDRYETWLAEMMIAQLLAPAIPPTS